MSDSEQANVTTRAPAWWTMVIVVPVIPCGEGWGNPFGMHQPVGQYHILLADDSGAYEKVANFHPGYCTQEMVVATATELAEKLGIAPVKIDMTFYQNVPEDLT